MTRKVKPMRFFEELRLSRRARPVTITHVTVTYRAAFPLSVTTNVRGVEVDLAWSSKTETAITDTGQVWSERTIAGPDIDRVVVSGTENLRYGVSDTLVTYPVWLGEAPCTLVSAEPGLLVLSQNT
jgi:hypothetical protein